MLCDRSEFKVKLRVGVKSGRVKSGRVKSGRVKSGGNLKNYVAHSEGRECMRNRSTSYVIPKLYLNLKSNLWKGYRDDIFT